MDFAYDTKNLTWTEYKFRCTDCGRMRRASQEAIDWTRKADGCYADDATDKEIGESFEFCIECVTGETILGESAMVREVKA